MSCLNVELKEDRDLGEGGRGERMFWRGEGRGEEGEKDGGGEVRRRG